MSEGCAATQPGDRIRKDFLYFLAKKAIGPRSSLRFAVTGVVFCFWRFAVTESAIRGDRLGASW
jgi:hypothetical protein